MLARATTELLAPVPVVGTLLAVVAFGSEPDAPLALRHTLVAEAIGVLIPLAGLAAGVWTGRFADHHIPDRRGRPLPFLLWAGALLAAGELARADGAGAGLTAATRAVAAVLVTAAAANAVWKLSLHTALVAAAVTAAAALVGPAALFAAPLLFLVAWARVRLRAHSVVQVLAAMLIGATVSWAVLARGPS
jgi:membrane-associated phospholipid phosphatase